MPTREEIIEVIIDVYEQYNYCSAGLRSKNIEKYKKELQTMSKRELLRELIDAINTALYYDPEKNIFDTMGLSAYANAVYILHKEDLFEIINGAGDRIIGRLTDRIKEIYY